MNAETQAEVSTGTPSRVPVRRALLSVSDKTDIIPFARALQERNIEIVSTGGTAAALREAGMTVIAVESVTGFAEMMDGRVKTLHPAIHGGLLARRDLPGHVQAMQDHNITPIDLLCVNLYPFERTIREDLGHVEAIELIDIGGPAMIRSAAKNHDFVAVVTSPTQYDRVANELRKHDGATTLELRRDLAAAAFSRTAAYDAAISSWMSGQRDRQFAPMMRISQTRIAQLRYGENPHQQAAVYANPGERGVNVVTAPLLAGKPLSYNNLNDAAAALELVADLAQQGRSSNAIAAAVIKHTNPCGAAVADNALAALDLALQGDPVAAFGGIVAISAAVTQDVADSITNAKQVFFEVIVAPAFDTEAVATLSNRWKNVRLLAVGDMHDRVHLDPLEWNSIPGGMLVQQRDLTLPDPSGQWQHAAGPAVTDAATLAHAATTWIIAKHLKSNAIAIVRDGQLIGAGAGQMDRVTSARLAIEKAGERLQQGGASPLIAASDGFFPFADGPLALIEAGISIIIQPGGSMRDQETIDLCTSRDVALYHTGIRHFRH
ncbi:MAG: bifunctional phosphoribosylaminoimidazolecarboxamide formyltransferase/IMP cyclohydrolase [Phycisphaerales bacterium]